MMPTRTEGKMHMIVVNRCTIESHECLRANRTRFVTATSLLGWQPDGDGGEFELRRCKRCGSTLSDGTTRKEESCG